MLQWNEAILKSVETVSTQTSIFKFEINGVDSFDFIPGQFITFDLPIHEKKTKRLKSYSIASPPNSTNQVELIIVKVDGGLGTEYLFNQEKCPIGTKLKYRGPAGVFTLPKNLELPYFLICTGTGVAPFRSMILHIKEKKIKFKEIHLIFGTRTQSDILYKNELEQLDQEIENFHYEIVLSREDWKGHKGYVHKVYKELAQGKENAHFMLCGWRNMIDQARKELSELNYPKEQIDFELYG